MAPTWLYKDHYLSDIVDFNRLKKGHLQIDQFNDYVFSPPEFESVRDPFEFEGLMLILERELDRAVREWEAERRRSRYIGD